MTKKVVFVADDFGQTPGINKAVIDSYEKGIVRSVSIVINGKSAEEALEYAIQHPEMETGLHLALVAESPVLPIEKVRSLIDPATNRFTDNRFILFLRIMLGRISDLEIEAELEEQILKFKSTGLSCSFVNSHDHVHYFPVIFPIVIRLCRKHNIPYIRIPNEQISLNPGVMQSIAFWKSIWGRRNASRIVLRILYLVFYRKHDFINVKKTDHFQGILYNCVNTIESLKNILTSLKPGVTEIICHPAYIDREYSNLPTYKYMRNYRREEETKALCSPVIRKLLRENNIELTTFRNLIPEQYT